MAHHRLANCRAQGLTIISPPAPEPQTRAVRLRRHFRAARGVGEADEGHAAVDRLVLARPHEIGLMPDADVAARVFHPPVELDPGGPVLLVGRPRVALEVIEAAPILDEHGRQPRAHRAEKPDLGRRGWRPLAVLPCLVKSDNLDQDFHVDRRIGCASLRARERAAVVSRPGRGGDGMKSDSFVRAAKIDELRGAGPFAASASGVDVVLVRTRSGWRAFQGRCPHQGALLGEGEIEGDALVCRNHRWRFSIASGLREGGPECLDLLPDRRARRGPLRRRVGPDAGLPQACADAVDRRFARPQGAAAGRQPPPARTRQSPPDPRRMAQGVRSGLSVPDGRGSRRRHEQPGLDRGSLARASRDVPARRQGRHGPLGTRDRGGVQRRGRSLAAAAQALRRGACAATPASVVPAHKDCRRATERAMAEHGRGGREPRHRR